MSLTVGIVGLPNVGKSTLFNALLRKQAALAANYPFATIEPNVGIVPVPDERLNVLAEIVGTSNIVPATVSFTDIAGLVEGASKGEGLGNQFLANIREVELICHVIRYFEDEEIHHVTGSVDPIRDRGIIETELIFADLVTLENQKPPRGKLEKDEARRWDLIEKLKKELDQGKLARTVITDPEDRMLVRDLHLLTMKPVLYVLNVSEESLGESSEAGFEEILGTDVLSGSRGLIVTQISAQIEQELSQLSVEEQTEYLAELGVGGSGLERLISGAYKRLGLISFLTAGEKEVRAWTVREGSTAQEAAGEIHTDFAKNFVKAEVISYDEFVSLGGWKEAFTAGKVRLEGKEYIVKDGDVITIKANA